MFPTIASANGSMVVPDVGAGNTGVGAGNAGVGAGNDGVGAGKVGLGTNKAGLVGSGSLGVGLFEGSTIQ